MSSGGRAPQRRSPLYRLPVDGDGAGLLDVGAAPLYEVLDHLTVAVPAGEDEGRRAVCLGGHELFDLVFGAVLQEDLKQEN